MSEAYACALPYKDHVNLAFYRGAYLADPAAKLRGTGKAMRHLQLTKPEQLDDPVVRRLLVAARVERQEALRWPGSQRLSQATILIGKTCAGYVELFQSLGGSFAGQCR